MNVCACRSIHTFRFIWYLLQWNCSMHSHMYTSWWTIHRTYQMLMLFVRKRTSIAIVFIFFFCQSRMSTFLLNKQYASWVCLRLIYLFIKCNVPLLFSSFLLLLLVLSTIHRMFCIHKEMNVRNQSTDQINKQTRINVCNVHTHTHRAHKIWMNATDFSHLKVLRSNQMFAPEKWDCWCATVLYLNIKFYSLALNTCANHLKI